MSWLVESSLSALQRFCVNVLKRGPVPRHVAFIMDGNRRYASKSHLEHSQGHLRGFEKLAETLQWCLELGIAEVTVYAFSIENFSRSKEEVEKLMGLAEEKFEKLLEERERIMQEGVCIRVIGNMSLLSDKLKKLIAQAVLMTRHNTKAFLNVAFAYTSRDEIANAMKTAIEGVRNKEIDAKDINVLLLSGCLYTNLSPDPDMLIRTSGEARLSDFLLWQVSEFTHIYFTKVLWPEFTIWHLLGAVFQYQRRCRQAPLACNRIEGLSERAQKFLLCVQERRFELLRSYC